jgi:prolyl-tRNA editing enzyme YbaK/EbsC (Cys-tRNA(Pro) deacylase)
MQNPPDGSLPDKCQRVRAALAQKGLDVEIRIFPETTRTAAEAAVAIGCNQAQIAKSLIFQARDSGRPVLAVLSGTNRLDTARLQTLLGEKVGRADANFVRQTTGFAIGGVPPLGHEKPVVTYFDRDLLGYGEIWAAAGTPFSVFGCEPKALAAACQAEVSDLAQGRPLDLPFGPNCA